MTISATPFALQNGSHSAALFRQAVSSVVPNTGGLVQLGDLAVTQTGTPSMGVQVGVGRAWVPGTNVANFSGTTYSSQAQYFALNDAPVTLTVSASDPTNPRIDIVCLTVNDSQYAGATNSAVLQVITGSPAASPIAPTAPANSLVLAQVSVAANSASITNANVTAKAAPCTFKHAEYVNNGSFAVAASQPWDIGALTADAGNTWNNTFSAAGATSGTVNISETGVYAAHVRVVPSVDPGTGYVRITVNGTAVSETTHISGTNTLWECSAQHSNLVLHSGDTLRGIYLATNACNISSRLTITKVQG